MLRTRLSPGIIASHQLKKNTLYCDNFFAPLEGPANELLLPIFLAKYTDNKFFP